MGRDPLGSNFIWSLFSVIANPKRFGQTPGKPGLDYSNNNTSANQPTHFASLTRRFIGAAFGFTTTGFAVARGGERLRMLLGCGPVTGEQVCSIFRMLNPRDLRLFFVIVRIYIQAESRSNYLSLTHPLQKIRH
jgi:hypothetical protein